MTPWSVSPLPMPESLDSPDAWGVLGAADIGATISHDLWGHFDLAEPADLLLATLKEQTRVTRHSFVATRDVGRARPTPDDVLGASYVRFRTAEAMQPAYIDVVVSPTARRQGIGSALLAAAESVIAASGRTSIIGESSHSGEPPASEPRAITPPTGAGRIMSDDAAVLFAQSHGYSLEQGDRLSTLRPSLADPSRLAQFHDDAVVAANGYTVISWVAHCPDERAEQLTALLTSMSTAAPSAGLDIVESVWDVARLRDYEASLAATGRSMVFSAAVHTESDTLAAYTQIGWPRNYDTVAFQDDTFVLPAHRGHRLGMLVKTVNLAELARIRPTIERIHTWNAEENHHMLSINEALGYEGVGVVAMWQKRLGRSAPDA